MVQTSRPAAMWISSSRPSMSRAFTVNEAMKTGGRHRSRQGSARTRESNRFEMEAALGNFFSAALHNWVTGSTSDHCYFSSVVGKFRLQSLVSVSRNFSQRSFWCHLSRRRAIPASIAASSPPPQDYGWWLPHSYSRAASSATVLSLLTVVQATVAQNTNLGIECKWRQAENSDEPMNGTQNR